MSEEENFTPGRVASLIEGLRGEFKVVLDVILPLRQDMVEVKERLSAVETRVGSLEDVVRVAIPNLATRVERLETKAGF